MSIYKTVYNFRLIKSTKDEGEEGISRKLVVKAYSRNLDYPNFYFVLRCNYKTQETFMVESISIVDDCRFSKEQEKKIYLMGAFDFGAPHYVDRAFDELKRELNGAVPEDRIYSERWDKFSSQLKDWYNQRVKALFEKDIELTKLYFGDHD